MKKALFILFLVVSTIVSAEVTIKTISEKTIAGVDCRYEYYVYDSAPSDTNYCVNLMYRDKGYILDSVANIVFVVIPVGKELNVFVSDIQYLLLKIDEKSGIERKRTKYYMSLSPPSPTIRIYDPETKNNGYMSFNKSEAQELLTWLSSIKR